VLLLTIVVLGLAAGWVANLLLGGGTRPANWGELLAAGLIGSLVGGLVLSAIFGDGLEIRPSGLIGSVLGAVIVLAIWRAIRGDRQRA
jgi:uncharacterized membrane protein YeaQ/YmgE (transglycosylase-associated protein family)